MASHVSDADMAELSPLQQRLLSTYMTALKDQEEEHAPAPAPAPSHRVGPEPPAPTITPSKKIMSRSDMYSKKMGELLLKGWKMLGENCPETGEVPLMQHPTSGRKFSIATGRYTDEAAEDDMVVVSPPVRSPVHSPVRSPVKPRSPSPTPMSAVKPLFAPAPAPGGEYTELRKSESDAWCEDLSALMLKGWKMLNEQCPDTQLVPLMQEPKGTRMRKYSVATRKYFEPDEVPSLPPRNPAAAGAAAAAASPSAPVQMSLAAAAARAGSGMHHAERLAEKLSIAAEARNRRVAAVQPVCSQQPPWNPSDLRCSAPPHPPHPRAAPRPRARR